MKLVEKRAARIDRLQLPERATELGKSLGESEREILLWPTPDGDILNLTYADTHSFPPPPWALEEFVRAANGAMSSYTAYRGHLPVLQEVAINLSEFIGIRIDPERQILLTAGSQAGLFAALAVLVEEHERVALLDPDYLSTERMLRFFGANVHHVPLEWREDPPTVDLQELERAFKAGARLFVFSHPNNPTGAVFPLETLEEIAELIRKYDAYVLVDELYARLVYDDRPFYHLISLPGMRDRCVTSLGPSKAESMTGYRIGVLVVPSSLANAIEDVIAITSIRAPSYSQFILRRWLKDDRAFMAERIRVYQALRDQTVGVFQGIPGVWVCRSNATSYVFINTAKLGYPDQVVARHLLDTAHVVVNPGYQFGPRGIGNVRICFAQNPTTWESRLIQIAGALKQLGAK
jgi:aspartate/methionine/tyrosine aminotransferase